MITLHCCRCMVVWNRWFRFNTRLLHNVASCGSLKKKNSTFQVSKKFNLRSRITMVHVSYSSYASATVML